MRKQTHRILVINPGSTSTKVALFEDEKEDFSVSIAHSEKELRGFRGISNQYAWRVDVIKRVLEENTIDLRTIDSVVGRGGLLRSIPGGTYRVNERMLDDLREAKRGEHACNLGGLIAHEIAQEVKVASFIVDSVVVDEMEPVARISGMPELERRSIFHALNQKAVARRAAQELDKRYDEVNLIVAHMGGGISVGAHAKGRVVDANNAFDGDGPFAPERAGGLPVGQLVELCFSGKYTQAELKERLVGQAGMVAYLSTNDMRKTKEMVAAGDEKAKLVYEAMAYQVAKEIGCRATVLKGQVDGIVLSGGLTHDQEFVEMIRERVRWIARVFVYPGEKEMEALALGALRVLRDEEEVKTY